MNKPTIQITDEFKRAIKLMDAAKRPVLISGPAGTGKSTLLRHWRENSHSSVVVLAPTGVAALNVRGQTIHRFFGFGIDTQPDVIRTESFRRIPGHRRELYKRLETVVIDEASMLRAATGRSVAWRLAASTWCS